MSGAEEQLLHSAYDNVLSVEWRLYIRRLHDHIEPGGDFEAANTLVVRVRAGDSAEAGHDVFKGAGHGVYKFDEAINLYDAAQEYGIGDVGDGLAAIFSIMPHEHNSSVTLICADGSARPCSIVRIQDHPVDAYVCLTDRAPVELRFAVDGRSLTVAIDANDFEFRR